MARVKKWPRREKVLAKRLKKWLNYVILVCLNRLCAYIMRKKTSLNMVNYSLINRAISQLRKEWLYKRYRFLCEPENLIAVCLNCVTHFTVWLDKWTMKGLETRGERWHNQRGDRYWNIGAEIQTVDNIRCQMKVT